jgi:hypothetical protein
LHFRSSIEIDRNHSKGDRLMRFLIVTASLVTLNAAAAADLPHPQPPPPAPVVGKAPIGKVPVGKAPIGKYPVGKSPQPIATKG